MEDPEDHLGNVILDLIPHGKVLAIIDDKIVEIEASDLPEKAQAAAWDRYFDATFAVDPESYAQA